MPQGGSFKYLKIYYSNETILMLYTFLIIFVVACEILMFCTWKKLSVSVFRGSTIDTSLYLLFFSFTRHRLSPKIFSKGFFRKGFRTSIYKNGKKKKVFCKGAPFNILFILCFSICCNRNTKSMKIVSRFMRYTLMTDRGTAGC